MSHEVETAVYVKVPAWHGLGTVLPDAPSIADAIKAAGLDWTVGLERLQLADGTMVDRWGVVRSSDHRVLGTVGKGFRTVQNAAAFDWFQPFLDGGLVALEAAGSLRKGSRVWVLAKVLNHGHADAVIVPASDDRVANYLLLAHGHDGSLAIHLGLTPTRVVCQNTLSAAIGENTSIRIRHTQGAADAMLAARETIDRVNGQFDKAADVFRALAGVYVRSGAQIRQFIDRVFPVQKSVQRATEAYKGVDAVALMESVRAEESNTALVGELLTSGGERAVGDDARRRIYDSIEALFTGGTGNDMAGVKGTAWAAYNAVTEYITHERGRSDDNRLNGAWFGPESARAIQGAADTFLNA